MKSIIIIITLFLFINYANGYYKKRFCHQCNWRTCIYNSSNYDLVGCKCAYGECGARCNKELYSKKRITGSFNIPFIGLPVWKSYGLFYSILWYPNIILCCLIILLIIKYLLTQKPLVYKSNLLFPFIIVVKLYIDISDHLNNLEDKIYCL
jgi:hypothetical protein